MAAATKNTLSVLLSIGLFAGVATAQEYDNTGLELGDEYGDYAVGTSRESQYQGGTQKRSLVEGIILYFPNRLLDLIDIFRVDVGVGGAYGGVLRLTKYGQLGYRYINPVTARIGLRGRRVPVFAEKRTEEGFGPNFRTSPERNVTMFEFGVSADLILGAYAGVSLDELADFALGIFTIDIKNDDL